MNVAVATAGACVVFCLAAAVAFFVVDQPGAAWATLVVALLSTISIVAMLASDTRANVTEITARRTR